MAYDNSNRGSIWKNDKKQKETDADFTGALDVDGVQYWVSAWKRKADAKPSAPALSFSIKRKDEVHKHGVNQARQAAPAPAQRPQQAPQQFDDFGDDPPF